MAMPKNARSISVGKLRFKWMVSRASDILSVPVLIQEAGGLGPLLRLDFFVATEWSETKNANRYQLKQVTSVTPGGVRKAIGEAMDLGWDPLESNDLQFRIDWDGSVCLRRYPAWGQRRLRAIDDDESWRLGDPLSALTYYLTEFGMPHPGWVAKWSVEGKDPLFAVWQATVCPAIMFDVLVVARECACLVAILHAFAFRTGKVGELLSLESMGFETGAGWYRHLDGTNEGLSEEEKMRSIWEDIASLSQCARERASIDDFRIRLRETSDIGTHGDWGTFLRVTAELIRSIVPTPPTLDELTKRW